MAPNGDEPCTHADRYGKGLVAFYRELVQCCTDPLFALIYPNLRRTTLAERLADDATILIPSYLLQWFTACSQTWTASP